LAVLLRYRCWDDKAELKWLARASSEALQLRPSPRVSTHDANHKHINCDDPIPRVLVRFPVMALVYHYNNLLQ
jgi:hypothetical protein